MYRNYDGLGGAFGETGVRGTSANQDVVAVYAAQRTADGALTLMVINKSGQDRTSKLTVGNFAVGGAAARYQYSDANLTAIVRQADVAINPAGTTLTYPANSITLLVLPKA